MSAPDALYAALVARLLEQYTYRGPRFPTPYPDEAPDMLAELVEAGLLRLTDDQKPGWTREYELTQAGVDLIRNHGGKAPA